MDPTALGGTSGWVGAGLLGLVLGWLLLVYLPAKDKQLRELLDLFSKERQADRDNRHEMANVMQRAIVEMSEHHQAEIKAMEQQHRQDAIADRDAFLQRNSAIVEAITAQTSELKIEMREATATSCRWFKHLQDLERQAQERQNKGHRP